MKKFKTLSILFLGTMIVLFLSSCVKTRAEIAANKTETTTIETTTVVETTETTTATKKEETAEEMFLNLKDNVQPGSAGTSLKAAIQLAKILDKFYENQNTIDFYTVFYNIKDNYTNLSANEKEEWKETLDLVNSMVEDLLREKDIKEAFTSAGVENSHYPWNEEVVNWVFEVIVMIKEELN